MKSKFVAALLATMLLLSLACAYAPSALPVSATLNTVAYADAGEATVFAAILEWRYKVMADGYVYRRLYNTSTQQWETEWEKC